MAWIVGLIFIVIAIVFWRIFLPLALIGGLIVGGVYLNEERESNDREKQQKAEAISIQNKVTEAQKNATSEHKEWAIFSEPDPASGAEIVRTVSIQSDDGLCYLSVQKRVNGSELTGLDCSDIEISEHKDIEVKFDTANVSRAMHLDSYNDSDRIYIPSYQYSGELSYEDFLSGLKDAKYVAIYVPAEYTFWTRFSLKNSGVIRYLGGPLPDKTKGGFDLSTAKPVGTAQ